MAETSAEVPDGKTTSHVLGVLAYVLDSAGRDLNRKRFDFRANSLRRAGCTAPYFGLSGHQSA